MHDRSVRFTKSRCTRCRSTVDHSKATKPLASATLAVRHQVASRPLSAPFLGFIAFRRSSQITLRTIPSGKRSIIFILTVFATFFLGIPKKADQTAKRTKHIRGARSHYSRFRTSHTVINCIFKRKLYENCRR